MRTILGLACALAASVAWAQPMPTDISPQVLKIARDVRTAPGRLPQLEVTIDGQKRPLPLRHTQVFAELSAHVARVDVTQTYKNDHTRAIEAVYVFPLPENSAVDDLKIEVGGRVIVAEIQRRDEARATYEAARKAGQTAALLEQERPNIFTQSVANIPPGEEVKIHVRFVQQLTYDAGAYEWVFPMVVGPRFIPGNPEGQQGVGWSMDTDQVPDASRITPPIVGAGVRSGHDIELEVVIDSPLPVQDLETPTHEVEVVSEDSVLRLNLRKAGELPNRDFVLRYRVDGEAPQVAVLAHKQGKEGFVTLVVQPPKLDVQALVGRRELLFVVDVSGSMTGRPLALAKEVARLAISELGPDDTFNVYTFAGTTARAFTESRPANDENIKRSLDFVSNARAGGGTMLADAVEEALSPAIPQGRHRYVVFLTDGFVGNEEAIFARASDLVVAATRTGQRARVFVVGTGNNVNHYLVNGLAEAGKGLGLTATLAEDPAEAVRRIDRLVDSPVVRDVVIDWGGLPVEDVYPNVIPDLLASRPLIVHGRYTGSGTAEIKVRGTTDDGPVELPLTVTLPEVSLRHPATPTLWARARVAELEKRLWDAHDQPAIDAIIETGLKHRIVTAYTSFVAVDRSRKVGDGQAPQVVQPVEAPDGVDVSRAAPPQAVVGRGAAMKSNRGAYRIQTRSYRAPAVRASGGAVEGGVGTRGKLGGKGAAGEGDAGGGEVRTKFYNFEDIQVDGQYVKPDALDTQDRPSPEFGPLITLHKEVLTVPGRPDPRTVGYVGEDVGLGGVGRDTRGVVRAEEAVVQGALDARVIQRVMRMRQAGIRACYEKALQKNPKLKGRVVFKLTIGPTGAVTLVAVQEDTLKDKDAVACMEAQIRRYRFPATEGAGVVQVVYPFVFASEPTQ